MSYEVTIHARAEARLLSRAAHVIVWQGAPLQELHYWALDADDVCIRYTADCNAARLRRLLAHFRKIPGVDSVTAQTSVSTGSVQSVP